MLIAFCQAEKELVTLSTARSIFKKGKGRQPPEQYDSKGERKKIFGYIWQSNWAKFSVSKS